MIWSYINKPCIQLIDSLVLSYPQPEEYPKYYHEFWNRRKAEQNDSIVYVVLRELKEELVLEKPQELNEKIVNDTLFNLIRIKVEKPGNLEQALGNFHYLVNIGLHQSAYNMLYESSTYVDLDWDRKTLEAELTTDTLGCCADPIIEDDTK